MLSYKTLKKQTEDPDPEPEDSFFDGQSWVGYRTHVRLVRDAAHSHRPCRLFGPADVYDAFASLSALDRECFYTVHLDRQNQVCGVELVSQGTVDTSVVAPREVYKSAILTNASGLILLHNHPSGIPDPSPEDLLLTEVLREGGHLLGIPVIDHIIIGAERYFSFLEEGVLDPEMDE